MGQELIAELNSFEVRAGNIALTCARRITTAIWIATALALWSAVGRPSGKVEVGGLENWYA